MAKPLFGTAWGAWEEVQVPDWHANRTGIIRALRNRVYSVQISRHATAWGLVMHLWIRRHDTQPVRSWFDVQRIKNELVAPECTGVEVYPKESRKIDVANIYHLYVLPAGFELPFGLHEEGA